MRMPPDCLKTKDHDPYALALEEARQALRRAVTAKIGAASTFADRETASQEVMDEVVRRARQEMRVGHSKSVEAAGSADDIDTLAGQENL